MALIVFDTRRITTKVMYRAYIKQVVDKWWNSLNLDKQKEVYHTIFPKTQFKKLGEKDMRLVYNRNNDRLISYEVFKKIVGDINKKVVDECLEGGVYSFGNNVGTLEIVKFNREPYLDGEGNLKGIKPDYNATKLNKASGGTSTVYHTDKVVCRWFWSKKGFTLPNRGKWCFKPTDGPKGISRKLSHHTDENPRSKMHFREIKLKRKQNVEGSKQS